MRAGSVEEPEAYRSQGVYCGCLLSPAETRLGSSIYQETLARHSSGLFRCTFGNSLEICKRRFDEIFVLMNEIAYM